MPTLPEDTLAVAENLLRAADQKAEGNEKEACLRAAVSRLYYAAFTKARHFAENCGYQYYDCPKNLKLGTHEALWKWWFVEESPDHELSTWGDALLGMRIYADYSPDRFFGGNSPVKAQVAAKNIIQAVNSRLKSD